MEPLDLDMLPTHVPEFEPTPTVPPRPKVVAGAGLGLPADVNIEDIAKHLPEGYNIDNGMMKALTKIKRQVGSDYSTSIVRNAAMVCQGAACPMVQDAARTKDPAARRDLTKCMCPLYEIEREPLNQTCPIESYTATNLLNYMIDSLKINRTNFGDISIVQDMVSLMMAQQRLMRELAQAPSGLVDDHVVSGTATVIRKQLNPLFQGIKMLADLISQKRNELIATPDKRHRAKIDQIGAAAKMVDASSKLKELLNRRKGGIIENRQDIAAQALEIEPSVLEKDEEILQMQQRDMERAGINQAPQSYSTQGTEDFEDDE